MDHWLIEIMNAYGYMGIMFLIAIENIFPPIPSEVILTFGGFMTTFTDAKIWYVVIAATLGSVVGAIILYIVGLQLDIRRLEIIVDKWGHILRLTKSDLHQANAWFDKFGPWTIFFCRFIPLIRSIISIPAGMSHMNVIVFLLFTTLGTFLWNIVLVSLGAKLAGSWETIVMYMDIYANIIYVLLLIFGLILIVWLIRRKR
ncbi:DedA family protein [Ornithinibacillus gellani]|uniref:DedA family protein n=1 Tax=Ornithinibacillus gellani TaxID=2293253 RepID=UPI000F4AB116|nr:DedA family protein [Ornithinibacillus gellani]TQS74452.1 DedA family protein [Ornithinibacillus gellani]